MPRPIRILLIDGHAAFRWGVRLLLEEQPDFAVAGEAGTVEAGLALLARAGGAVDVVVVGHGPPVPGGPAAIRAAKAQPDPPRAILLASAADPVPRLAATAAGADAVVAKTAAVADLVAAIRVATLHTVPSRRAPAIGGRPALHTVPSRRAPAIGGRPALNSRPSGRLARRRGVRGHTGRA